MISYLNNSDFRSKIHSSSKLAECSDYTVNSVSGVVKRWNVASSPRELGAYSCENAILVVVLGSEIANFLLGG